MQAEVEITLVISLY